MTSSEKALCDTIVASRGLSARSRSTFQTALADDLRIHMDQLATFDRGLVSDLASEWPSQRLARLAEVIAHE